MTQVATGQRAKAAAALFLEGKGCKIVTRNWRTTRCEIDMVATRHGIVYFCEVKYRLTTAQGSGLDYITPAKLSQMQFAAESCVHVEQWKGEYQLCLRLRQQLQYESSRV
jgi:Holliday junction resolvase-like predicted endonuclease